MIGIGVAEQGSECSEHRVSGKCPEDEDLILPSQSFLFSCSVITHITRHIPSDSSLCGHPAANFLLQHIASCIQWKLTTLNTEDDILKIISLII